MSRLAGFLLNRAWLPASVGLVVHQALLGRPFIDDSYIFYRYAENFAHGLGPVFNRGDWVEGYSSFTWTVLLALGRIVGLSPARAAAILGVGFGVGCVLIVFRLARRLLPESPWFPCLVAFALAASPAFASYVSSGMDATLSAFVLLGAVAALTGYATALRNGTMSRSTMALMGSSLVLLLLTRPEGVVYATVLGAAALALTRLRTDSEISTPLRLAPLLAALIGTLLLAIVRELVYGRLAPATVLAKGYTTHLVAHLEVSALWQQLRMGLGYSGAVTGMAVALIAAGLVVSRRRRIPVPLPVPLSAVVLAVALAVATWSGGDWMPYRRLLVPVAPLTILLTGWAATVVARALVTGLRRPSVSAVAAVVGCSVGVLAVGVNAGSVAPRYEATQLARIGDLLRTSRQPLRLLTNLAGILPYHAGTRTYVWDMLGLTDIHNATQGEIFSPEFGRTDPGYDFTRPFDLFVSNSSWDFALLLSAPVDRQGEAGYVSITKPEWAAIPLYVAVRRNDPLIAPLAKLCACRPVTLSSGLRSALLARLIRSGSVPPGLTDAAARRRFFPT